MQQILIKKKKKQDCKLLLSIKFTRYIRNILIKRTRKSSITRDLQLGISVQYRRIDFSLIKEREKTTCNILFPRSIINFIWRLPTEMKNQRYESRGIFSPRRKQIHLRLTFLNNQRNQKNSSNSSFLVIDRNRIQKSLQIDPTESIEQNFKE